MKPNGRQRLFVYSGTVLVLAGLVFLANVYAKTSQEQLDQARETSLIQSSKLAGEKKVKVLRVFPQPLEDLLILPGTVEAYEDIELATKRSGAVEWIGPKEGEQVRSGDELIRLDTDVLKAQAEKARADYELSALKFKRAQQLFSQNVVPPESFEEAEANLKAASAILEEVEAQLAEGTLLSPIDGALDRRYVDRGEHVREGQAVMKIVDVDTVKVVFDVPEKDIRFYRPGQVVEILASESNSYSCTGTIEYVALTADLPARTYPLKVVVDNRAGCLRPGMIVRGGLVRRRLENGIAVPFYSLVERENGKSLFVVEDGKAEERPIVYGMFQRGMLEIVEGLNAGDALVVVGQRDLVQGQPVSIAADLTQDARRLVEEGLDLTKLVTD